MDLYLIHQPYGDVPGAWKVMEDAKKEGKIRSIGVSNMTVKIWNNFIPQFDTMPSVNQIEFNPYCQRKEMRKIMADAGVALEAWGTLGQGNKDMLADPVIVKIAEAHQLQVRSMHSLIRVWFLNSFLPPNNQCGAYILHWYIHQYCFCVDYILQILFSSYLISLSFNQSSVTKIRSISISSPCHFYFVLYCFIDFSWSPLPLRSAQSRGPPDLLCPCICPYQSS